MIHRIAALALALAIGGASPGFAQSGSTAAVIDPENLTIANEIVDLSYPPDQRRSMFTRAVGAMQAQARSALLETAGAEADQGMLRIIDRHFERSRAVVDSSIEAHSSALFAAFSRAYARQFSREELTQIRAFVATPTGRQFLQRSSELLTDPDVAQANTAYMRSVFSALQPLQAEMRREALEYFRTRRGRR